MDDDEFFFTEAARDEDDPDMRFFYRETARDLRAEREEREALELQKLEHDKQRLTIEDCANPMFDRFRPVKRRVHCRDRGEWAYEWVTITDDFNKIGCTYFLRDGLLSIVAFDPRNARLFEKVVQTPPELARAMKAADRKHRGLMSVRRAPSSRKKTRKK